jgi:hypothetical protein
MPELSRIRVYPIKALDGVEVDAVSVRGEGWIEYDRRFALFDADGDYVNARRNELVHGIGADFDLDAGTVELRAEGSTVRADLDGLDENDEVAAWLSEYFDEPVTVERAGKANFTDSAGGLVPTRISATGPTVVGAETLREVAAWYEGITVEGIRRRLRTNLELAGGEPFWEDRLFTDPDHAVEFTVGDVTLHGILSKPRCVTPSRDPDTGERTEDFSATFVENRRETFPDWADPDHLGQHVEYDPEGYFYLTVVTRIPASEAGATLSVGDGVEVEGEVPLLGTL